MQETWKIEETCAGPCTPREIYNNYDPLTRTFKEGTMDEKGFHTCGFCGKPWRSELKQCPDCGVFFKGPKPYKPLKFALECENCE